MADKRYGVGVAGISWVSHEHIKAFQNNPHTRVVALQSASRDNAEQARARHGLVDAEVYTDYEKMLADPRTFPIRRGSASSNRPSCSRTRRINARRPPK